MSKKSPQLTYNWKTQKWKNGGLALARALALVSKLLLNTQWNMAQDNGG